MRDTFKGVIGDIPGIRAVAELDNAPSPCL